MLVVPGRDRNTLSNVRSNANDQDERPRLILFSTVTATATAFSGVTISVTSTTTITQPTSVTLTITSEVDVISTVTVPSPSDSTSTIQVITLEKRDPTAPASACPITSSATAIPTYASSCQGSTGYAAACSYYGITASTTTLPQQTATVTSTSTEIDSTTQTIWTTSFLAVPTTVATVVTTVTSTVATVTVTSAATPTFYLRATYPASDAGNTNLFGYTAPLGSGAAYFINFTPSPTDAVQFALDPASGTLTALNGPAAQDMAFYSQTVGQSSFVLVTTSTFATSQGGQLLSCSIGSQGSLNCHFGSNTAAFWLCGNHLNVVQPGYDFTNTCSAGTAEQISLSVVPVN